MTRPWMCHALDHGINEFDPEWCILEKKKSLCIRYIGSDWSRPLLYRLENETKFPCIFFYSQYNMTKIDLTLTKFDFIKFYH